MQIQQSPHQRKNTYISSLYFWLLICTTYMACFYPFLLVLFFNLLMLCFLTFGSTILTDNTFHEQFENWVDEHGKVYTCDTERQHRLEVFADNVNFIEKFNSEKKYGYTLSINHFADLTREEFVAKHSGATPSAPALHPSDQLNRTSVPVSVDWRSRGAVTDIKDQGDCGNVTIIFI